MRATEVIEELKKQIKKNGDCEVYFEYDSGIRIICDDITYFKEIESNAYSEHWPDLKEVFIINHDIDG